MRSQVGKELVQRLCRFAWFHVRGNRFSLELFYFLFVSLFGFFLLQTLDGRTTGFTPTKLDLLFTSVSSVTTSSMSAIEMEFFSNTQLVVLMILIFVGGEVFTSLVMHYIHMFFINVSPKDCSIVNPSNQCGFFDKIELQNIKIHEFGNSKSDNLCNETLSTTENYMDDNLRYKSLKFLGVVVLFYLVCVQVFGLISVSIYLNVVSSAKDILNQKGLHSLTFSIFTSVSTFANCGFLPTNENMLIFRKHSGLLLILIPQALLGNTLFPPAFRSLIWAIGKFFKKTETSYLLNNSKDMIGYHHHHSFVHMSLLSISALGLIMMQYVLFSSMEWSSGSLSGLNVYQKLVGILFQTVNTRHAGESIVDLSTVSGAVLVLLVLMMYLPPYTLFLPVEEEVNYNSEKGNKKSTKILENLVFSQQTYLIIFIILVCITERKQMVSDPLNFNVLNIVFEVISAYGNVGLSTGYRCDLRLKQDGGCQNKWYGFSGKWSDEGKLVLIVVMIFGKLKKFNMNGGKTWKVL